MNDTTVKSASAAGLLEEIRAKAHNQDEQWAAAYREGLKDAAGFMGLAGTMSDQLPQKKGLQERFSRYVNGDFSD